MTTTGTTRSTLDEAVRQARADLRRRDPAAGTSVEALYLLATGVGPLGGRLADRIDVPLGELQGTPSGWEHATLACGRLGELRVWLLDDPGGSADAEPAWSAGFPCWLAAACGARVLVHTAAGCGLEGGPRRGSLAVLEDHVRCGDHNPLVGIGESELGPLFPDLSRLYDAPLRRAALERGARSGLDVSTTVGALTRGPALDTPAERRSFARLGAGVALQGASAALLSAAHAGLVVLSIAAVTDEGLGTASLEQILAASRALAPGLEDLLASVAEDVCVRARSLAAERLP